MGTFDGLGIGLSALYAQRRAIDVAGQNIANVNTDGYSRQRATMVAESGPLVPARFSRYEGAGLGVRSVDVQRIRDQFLESQAHREHAVGSYLAAVQVTLGRIEMAHAEPSDTGLSAQLSDFWAGWDDVGNNPADPAARSQLLERATTLASSFRQLDGSLAGLASASREQLGALVADVNAVAERIAELNGSIRSTLASGLTANTLIDQRDLLAMGLADQIGATVRSGEGGELDVYLGGMALVRSSAVEALTVEVGAGPDHLSRVAWADDGLTATVGGTARGLLETNNELIPSQRVELAAVAQLLHDEVNAIHGTGYDQNGAPGAAFFQMGPNGIELNPLVAADVRFIAASAAPGAVDGSIAQQLAGQTGPDSQYRDLVVRLGVAAQTANRRMDVQATIVSQLDTARDSEAGVNLDEEMTSLVAFQHAYSAAARYVSVVDDLLQTLIGMV